MKITLEVSIRSTIDQVWTYWTQPEHILHWNFASDEWCCPAAINELYPNGKLNWRMEAKDGSVGFDFIGTYNQVVINELIKYTIADGRHVEIRFLQSDDQVIITESFDPEGLHSVDQQRQGWLSILENFKKYVESNN